jgi:hypothetical protein
LDQQDLVVLHQQAEMLEELQALHLQQKQFHHQVGQQD